MTDPVVTKELDLTYAEAAELGFRLHTAGRLQESEAIYRTLIAVHPGDQNVIHFLGVLMHQTGRRAEGQEMIERSLALDNGVAAWHNNYGNILLDANRFDEAEAAYRRCVELDPGNVEILCNLGVLCHSRKRFDEAEALLNRAVAAQPDFIGAHLNLATLYWEMGRFEDAYAQTASALQQSLRVLDAGCGTGLCGPYLAPYADMLKGVDLSANMLDLARGRGLYTELVKGELGAYLAGVTEPFDLIVSADALCRGAWSDKASLVNSQHRP